MKSGEKKPAPVEGRAWSAETDDSAGYFCTGVPCELGSEVVGVAVNHHGSADDIRDGKPVCHHSHKGAAIVFKERGKIAGVVWMETVFRVEMRFCFGKTDPCAGTALVDMERKNIGGAGCVAVGEPMNIGDHQRVFFCRIEGYCADGSGLDGFSTDVGNGAGRAKIKIQFNSPRDMLCTGSDDVKASWGLSSEEWNILG